VSLRRRSAPTGPRSASPLGPGGPLAYRTMGRPRDPIDLGGPMCPMGPEGWPAVKYMPGQFDHQPAEARAHRISRRQS
jgi:hypothetical protein